MHTHTHTHTKKPIYTYIYKIFLLKKKPMVLHSSVSPHPSSTSLKQQQKIPGMTEGNWNIPLTIGTLFHEFLKENLCRTLQVQMRQLEVLLRWKQWNKNTKASLDFQILRTTENVRSLGSPANRSRVSLHTVWRT